MAVYTYCRVSMGLRVDEADSLETQQRQVRGYAQIHGFTVAAHFVESGVSGLIPLGERTEGQRLLAVLKSGDVVITPKLNRMFRSARDALDTMNDLQEQGVALHMIDLGGDFTANGIAKLVSTILAAVAEAKKGRSRKRVVPVEPNRARERTVEVKRGQRDRERSNDKALHYGFKHLENGKIIAVLAEQDITRQVLQMRAEGYEFAAMLGFMCRQRVPRSRSVLKEILAFYPEKETIAEPQPPPKRKPRPYRSPWFDRKA